MTCGFFCNDFNFVHHFSSQNACRITWPGRIENVSFSYCMVLQGFFVHFSVSMVTECVHCHYQTFFICVVL